MLRVHLLGGLDVEGIDERELGSRQARTLLKMMALPRGPPYVAIVVAWIALTHVSMALAFHSPNYYHCKCVPNAFAVLDSPHAYDTLRSIENPNSALLSAGVFALLLVRFAKMTPAPRRALSGLWIASAFSALFEIVNNLASNNLNRSGFDLWGWVKDLAYAAIPIAFTIGLKGGRAGPGTHRSPRRRPLRPRWTRASSGAGPGARRPLRRGPLPGRGLRWPRRRRRPNPRPTPAWGRTGHDAARVPRRAARRTDPRPSTQRTTRADWQRLSAAGLSLRPWSRRHSSVPPPKADRFSPPRSCRS